MKKWWMAVLFMGLLLAACGTETTTDTSTQGSDSKSSVNEETEVTEETTEENEPADEQQVLTLYKSNANADQTIPEKYRGDHPEIRALSVYEEAMNGRGVVNG